MGGDPGNGTLMEVLEVKSLRAIKKFLKIPAIRIRLFSSYS